MAVELTSYRKGLTLGLTLAEIFILLLFLLLLILLGYYTVAEKRKVELQEALVAEQKKVEQFRELPKEKQDLVRKVMELQQQTETLQRENSINRNLLEEKSEDIEELQEEVERKSENLTELQEEIEQKSENLAELQEKIKQNNEILTESQEDVLPYAQKGIDPPCWYSVSNKGGVRKEHPHHLIDVAVHDKHLLIRLLDPPDDRAVEANGDKALTSYAEEYKALPLAPLRARSDPKTISTKKFLELTEPIHSKGKSEQVRDYACVFYARVWDETSPTAKKRWKDAERTIKKTFYVTPVLKDPWVKN